MKDLLNNMYSLGVGAAAASKEQIEKTVNDLVQRGEVKRSESNQLIDDLLAKGQKAQENMENMIQERTKQFLSSLDVPTKEEVDALKARVAALEKALSEKDAEK
ncbi:phasin family protein [Alkalihalobacillus clausii]|uniref:Polyhydroxyalkanoate synthesis regulator n=2 Tax=Bacillaceae TaxID=186817 RepID=A0A268P5B1_SHOCL|nr:ATP synthase subunit B [Shouchella clausii]MBU3231798.1 phasin family protein [Shouchella clausii]MBU3264918.1 phasin family protein [Shouchella clausii]MBU3507619.1 phasin family protein [Shouchella clausii]MBU3535818.1 phasin family protein [Shouchella clausii]